MGTFPKSRSHSLISSHSELINRPAHSKEMATHLHVAATVVCAEQHISLALLLHMPYSTALR